MKLLEEDRKYIYNSVYYDCLKIIKEAHHQQELNEKMNLKTLALSGLLAVAPSFIKALSDIPSEPSSTVQSTIEQQLSEVNVFKISTTGDTKDNAIKKAQNIIKNWCKQHNEKCLVVYKKGFEPHITLAHKDTFTEDNNKSTTEWSITYEVILMLSRKYNQSETNL